MKILQPQSGPITAIAFISYGKSAYPRLWYNFDSTDYNAWISFIE